MATSSKVSKLMMKLGDGKPWRWEGGLWNANGSVHTVLNKKALAHAGVDTKSPGGYEGWYFPNEGVMLIDLSDGDDDE